MKSIIQRFTKIQSGKVNFNFFIFLILIFINSGCENKKNLKGESKDSKDYLFDLKKINIDKDLESVSKIFSYEKFTLDSNREISCLIEKNYKYMLDKEKVKNDIFYFWLDSFMQNKDMCDYLTTTSSSNEKTYNFLKINGVKSIDLYGFLIILNNPVSNDNEDEKIFTVIPFLDMASCQENRNLAKSYYVRPLTDCKLVDKEYYSN